MKNNLSKFYRKLGATGIEMSPIGLGTVKFGRNEKVKYPQHFEIPDQKTLSSLISYAKELGINTLDTAPAYGTSEKTLGKLLIHQRQDWVIVSKCGEIFEKGISAYHFKPSKIIQSVNNSLSDLRTDYIDLILVHSDGHDLSIIEEDDAFATLENLKSQGKIRAYGMSSKTVEGGLMTVEKSDAVMVTYHQEDTSQKPVIEKAFSLNKGVLIKKALNSGHSMANTSLNLDQIYQHLFSIEGITSVIIGTINQTHLQQNVMAILKALTIANGEQVI